MTAPAKPSDDKVWAELTKPFEPDWIEKLPKALQARDDNKGRCQADPPARGNGGAWYSADGHYCGGWHARAVHLDYVGHAGITMRLNDVLGAGGWDLQPYAETQDGVPAISQSAFWVKLTILGVTKWELAANFFSPQEAIGDALRRAAMRFGIGTYLWSKSDHAFNLAAASADEPPAPDPETAKRDEILTAIQEAAAAAGVAPHEVAGEWAASHDGQHIAEATDIGALELLRDDLISRAA